MYSNYIKLVGFSNSYLDRYITITINNSSSSYNSIKCIFEIFYNDKLTTFLVPSIHLYQNNIKCLLPKLFPIDSQIIFLKISVDDFRMNYSFPITIYPMMIIKGIFPRECILLLINSLFQRRFIYFCTRTKFFQRTQLPI